MRVYLPATAADLTPTAGGMNLSAADRIGFTLTNPLAVRPAEEVEELEWEAFLTAAAASAQLVAADPQLAPIRVVISIDAPQATINASFPIPDSQLSRVHLTDLAAAKIAAIHVDEPAAAPQIAQLQANPDSPKALAAVMDADLLWYDPAELADIPIP